MRRGRSLAPAPLAALALACASLIAAPGSALGQARGGTPGAFDFYVLALSWSPGFCATNDNAEDRDQCRTGAGLGFVVHGLWPQNERGFPTDCGPAGRTPSRQALEQAAGLFPDDGLARYQWRKHGTCSGLSPTDYFAATRAARQAVAVPASFAQPQGRQTWTPIDLERAFVAANPGLRADMMSVLCRRDTFVEVRICFDKDLKGFRTCPEVDGRGCRVRDMIVNAPR